jgi:hypothetical protein
MWAKKKIRLWEIECGTWQAGLSTPHGLLPNKLFDHWGSVLRGDTRVLYTMPYGSPDALAETWAGIMDCELEIIKPGPWHEMTTCYVFLPALCKATTKRNNDNKPYHEQDATND